MAKFLARQGVPLLTAVLLTPQAPGLQSDLQVQDLKAHGFIPLYSGKRDLLERAAQLEALGALIAISRCDGALWPYQRFADAKDGLVRWALQDDLNFLRDLQKVDNTSSLLALLLRQAGELDESQRLAVDSVRLLGGFDSVLSYLAAIE